MVIGTVPRQVRTSFQSGEEELNNASDLESGGP